MTSPTESAGSVMATAYRLIGSMTGPIIMGYLVGWCLTHQWHWPSYWGLIATGIGIVLGMGWVIKEAMRLTDTTVAPRSPSDSNPPS